MKSHFVLLGPGRRCALAGLAASLAIVLPPATGLAADPAPAAPASPKPSVNAPAAPASPTPGVNAPAASTPAAPKTIQAPVDVGSLSTVPAPTVAAKAWITFDVTSGQVLAEYQADERIEPASLTKVMSAYVIFNALDDKRLSLEQTVPVSNKAWRTGGSRMFIEPRKPVTVDELLRGLVIQSGNDATVALAEAVAGSEDAFVALMNQEAARLGMKNTHFVNSTGLPDPQHVTTVRDLALLATRLIQDHPDHYGYYKMRQFTYNKITQPNRNRLLWVDPSIDGMKTGHTDAAGFCLIASSVKGDRRVLTVLVGATSENSRAQESLKLMNWGFQNFDTVRVYGAGQPVVEPKVWKGDVGQVKLGAPGAVWVTVPRGQAANVKPVIERTDPLVAPLQAGQQVGTLKLTLNDKPLREVPLTVLQPVGLSGFFGRAFDAVRLWFQ